MIQWTGADDRDPKSRHGGLLSPDGSLGGATSDTPRPRLVPNFEGSSAPSSSFSNGGSHVVDFAFLLRAPGGWRNHRVNRNMPDFGGALHSLPRQARSLRAHSFHLLKALAEVAGIALFLWLLAMTFGAFSLG